MDSVDIIQGMRLLQLNRIFPAHILAYVRALCSLKYSLLIAD